MTLENDPMSEIGSALAAELVDAEVTISPPPAPSPVHGRTGRVLLGLGIILISLNLRPLFASLSPVLPEIMADLHIAPAIASLITTFPVLCLGLFAVAAPGLAQRFGPERAIFGLLVAVALGTALRGIPSLPTLLLGSALAGGAVAVVNVLLPGLIKRDFPSRTGLMTGLFTTAICAGGAFGAALTVPIEHALGSWPVALAIWAVPTFVVALLWLPQALAAGAPSHGRRMSAPGLWRDPLAWQVTLVMGLQSALAYCIFGWLAPMLRERGLPADVAGYVVSASILAQMIACLVVPSVAMRFRDQRAIGLAIVAAAVIGFVGMVLGPLPAVWAFAALQGLGQGGALAVAMTLIILRSPDSRTAAHLSSMAQSVGYTVAACGPLVMGFIRQVSGGFGATIWLILAIGTGCSVAMLGAGRARHVLAFPQGHH